MHHDQKLSLETEEEAPLLSTGSTETTNAFLHQLEDHVLKKQADSFSHTTSLSRQTIDNDIERVRNFVIFMVCQDYQANPPAPVILSAEDRDHFLTMSRLVKATAGRMTLSDRNNIGPFYWRFLAQPCKILALPVQYVWDLLERFATTVTADPASRYHCPSSTGVSLQDDGAQIFATRLYWTRALVVPAVCSPSKDTHLETALIDALDACQAKYFRSIVGVQSSISPVDSNGQCNEWQDVIYELNDVGNATLSRADHLHADPLIRMPMNYWLPRVNQYLQNRPESEVNQAHKSSDYESQPQAQGHERLTPRTKDDEIVVVILLFFAINLVCWFIALAIHTLGGPSECVYVQP